MSSTSAAVAVKPASLVRASRPGVTFRQRFTANEANLQFLSCGEFEVPGGAASQEFCLPGRESLLFQWEGTSEVEVEGHTCRLALYDTLYIPRDTLFSIRNDAEENARMIQTSAPADNRHPVHHSLFAEISQREDRIRHLKGKDVYLMFDAAERADKLVAGYTFFEPYQRSWPPHNHTDREEVHIFIQGHGSMEVYEKPETLSFVHNVRKGDIVTIPFLNYHPVFSQEDPLQFIWCIAGERS